MKKPCVQVPEKLFDKLLNAAYCAWVWCPEDWKRFDIGSDGKPVFYGNKQQCRDSLKLYLLTRREHDERKKVYKEAEELRARFKYLAKKERP